MSSQTNLRSIPAGDRIGASWHAEDDMGKVAAHDFSGLAWPILVASYDRAQFEDFIFREGLVASSVRRLNASCENLAKFPDNKILLLLPGWDEDPTTAALGDRWIFGLDRYTVQLTGPKPLIFRHTRNMVTSGILLGLALWSLLGWLVLR